MDDIPNRPASWETSDAQDKNSFTIGELAGEFGITTRAIRFYEAKALITPQRVNSIRTYTRRDRARLILILRGKRLGYSLGEIREYLDLYDQDSSQLTQLSYLREKVTASITKLEEQQRDITDTLAELNELLEDIEKRKKDRQGL